MVLTQQLGAVFSTVSCRVGGQEADAEGRGGGGGEGNEEAV